MACGSRQVTIQLVDEEAGPGTRGLKPFRGQRYEAIRAACLDEGILFRDPYFPAGPDALGYDELGPDSEKAKGVEWMRPHVMYGRGLWGCWTPGMREEGAVGGLGFWSEGGGGCGGGWAPGPEGGGGWGGGWI